MFSEEGNDLIAVEVDPWFFAKGVVAAGHFYFAVLDIEVAELADDLAREIDRETEIVKRVNITLRARRQGGELVHVGERRDR